MENKNKNPNKSQNVKAQKLLEKLLGKKKFLNHLSLIKFILCYLGNCMR